MGPPGPVAVAGRDGLTRFKLIWILQSEVELPMEVPVTVRSCPMGTCWPSVGDVIVTAPSGNCEEALLLPGNDEDTGGDDGDDVSGFVGGSPGSSCPSPGWNNCKYEMFAIIATASITDISLEFN